MSVTFYLSCPACEYRFEHYIPEASCPVCGSQETRVRGIKERTLDDDEESALV